MTRWRVTAAALFAVGVALALVVYAQQPVEAPPPAQAPAGEATVDCNQYATVAFRVAVLRTVEAKLDLVIVQIRRELDGLPAALSDALAREARRVYAEGHPPAEARFQAYLRCQAVLGRFGAET